MKRLKLSIDALAVESFALHAGSPVRGTVNAAEDTVGQTCDMTCGNCGTEGYTYCFAMETCWASCNGTCRPDAGCGPDEQPTGSCEPSGFSQIYTCLPRC